MNVSNVKKEEKRKKREKCLQLSSESGFTQACPASSSQPPAQQDVQHSKQKSWGLEWVQGITELLDSIPQALLRLSEPLP